MDNHELAHWGIKGMKWGQRRYQNKDGTLTPAGKKRYRTEMAKLKEREKVAKNKEATKAKLAKLDAKKKEIEDLEKGRSTESSKVKGSTSTSPKRKSAKELTNEELASAIRRAELEKRYNELHPEQVSAGKAFVNNVLGPKLKQASADIITNAATKQAKKFLGLNDVDELGALKKEVDNLELKKRKAQAEDYLSRHWEKAKAKEAEKAAKEEAKDGSTDADTKTGKVYGEGKSKSSWNTDKSPIFDADWTEVKSDRRYDAGKDYVNNVLLLEEKNK